MSGSKSKTLRFPHCDAHVTNNWLISRYFTNFFVKIHNQNYLFLMENVANQYAIFYQGFLSCNIGIKTSQIGSFWACKKTKWLISRNFMNIFVKIHNQDYLFALENDVNWCAKIVKSCYGTPLLGNIFRQIVSTPIPGRDS